MSLRIPIETSARHVHICEEDFKILFGENAALHYVHELSQPGQYLCQERVTIVGPRGRFENVAILGPYRKETQIELSMTDTRKIGVPGIIRQSGYTEGTPGCRLIGPNGTIEIDKGVIVAKRHIHMTPLEASRAHVKDNDEVFVITESYERGLIFADVVVRVSPKFKLAMHVDTDEANAFGSEDAPTGAILKLFDGQTYSLQQWADEIQSGINR
ncbi:MAG: phosphate propanoyltransferase [Tyzzerella sp.]|nr:phosphate propanoyltransferase [Tyzzerella sp.]